MGVAKGMLAVAVAASLAVGGAVAGTGGAAEASAPATGPTLLEETFTGATVRDEGFLPLDDACLSGAAAGGGSAAPGPEDSTLGPCGSRRTGPVPPAGRVPGYLQLTDAGGGRTGGTVYDRPLPATGGIEVTFEQYQYGGRPDGGGDGGDGISFFLVDGARRLAGTGAYGGSLGYAQRTGEPGVDGGYLGVGLDPYGNYAVDFEGRGEGCPQDERAPARYRVYDRPPNNVTLRGPGQGTDRYCYLAGTGTADRVGTDSDGNALYGSTLPGRLRSAGDAPEGAKRTVRVRVTPDARPVVTIEIDFGGGAGFREVLRRTMPQAPPRTYKFGFAASTGSASDVHLIRQLRVRALRPLGELSLVKQVDRSRPQPKEYSVGDRAPFQFVVTNTGSRPLTGVRVTDDKISDVRCPSRVLAGAGSPRASMVCTGTRVITAGDAAAGSFTNTGRATGTDSGGTKIAARPSSVTVPVKKKTDPVKVPQPELTLSKRASRSTAQEGDTVTYTVTGTNTGKAPLLAGRFTDDLGGVLDDAVLRGGASASTGSVSYRRPTLTWTGDLAPGARVTVVYSVRVGSGGDGRLRNVVRASGVDGNCAKGADRRCRTTVTVSRGRLVVTKRADRAHVRVGGRVRYTITLANTGPGRLGRAAVTDDLRDLLAHADLAGRPAAGAGRLSYDRPVLSWSGPLAAGARVTIRYTAVVRRVGDGRMRNVAVSSTRGGNCTRATAGRDWRCGGDVRVLPKGPLKDG